MSTDIAQIKNLHEIDESITVHTLFAAVCGHDVPMNENCEAAGPKVKVTCQWFALCDRPATHDERHPVLGAVPCCDRCAQIGR